MVLDGLYMYIVYIYKYNFKTKMLLAKNIRHRYVLFTIVYAYIHIQQELDFTSTERASNQQNGGLVVACWKVLEPS